MTKTVLFVSLLLSSVSFAQFQQSNEPSIGDNVTMFLCDSFAPNYSTVTGTGVTWDYRNTGREGNNTKTITVVSPTASFPDANKGIEIQNFMTSYFASSAASRNSKGFEFNQPTLGTIKVDLSPNDELLMNYPFDVNDQLTDSYSGNMITGAGSFNCSGSADAIVDGRGTLKLNNATTLNNVIRYKLSDSTYANAGFTTVKMLRTQYEYYDFTVSNLPVFVHGTLVVKIGTSAPQTVRMVLSKYQPDGSVGIEANNLENIQVYPNPAQGAITVSGLSHNAALTLVDAQGKTVASSVVEPAAATLSLDGITAGMYFLHVTSNNETSIQKVIVQ